MAELSFGIQLRLLEQPEYHFILELLEIHTMKLGIYEQWPQLDMLGISGIVKTIFSRTSSSQKFSAWHEKFITHAIENNSDQVNGILGPVVQSGTGKKSTKQGHDMPQMLAEGSFVTFTGGDGVSTTLSAVQYFLARNPKTLEQLQLEVRSKFAAGDSITWGPELKSCTYLRACIDEALRLLPPALGVNWRRCQQDGTPIDERPFPAGLDVGVSLYTVLRSDEYFRDPSRFWPERWIEGTLPEAELGLAKRAFIPFLIGPRACAGSHVAVLFASVVLANLVNNFDIRMTGNQTLDREQDFDSFHSYWALPFWKSGPVLEFMPVGV